MKALDAPRATPVPPTVRPRRLRRTASIRRLVAETRLDPAMLIAPLFVRPGTAVREPIASMPGVDRLSPDQVVVEAERLADLGVGGILLFGLPAAKDPEGTGAWAPDGVVQEALRGRPGSRPSDRADRRHVPVRVHGSRTLRPAAAGRQRRQRCRADAPRPDRGQPGQVRCRHRGPERDDGRPGGGHPVGTRRGRSGGDRDHGLCGQDRVVVLRSVPGGGRQCSGDR